MGVPIPGLWAIGELTGRFYLIKACLPILAPDNYNCGLTICLEYPPATSALTSLTFDRLAGTAPANKL